LNLSLEEHSIRLARNTGWLAAGGVVTALLVVAQTALVARALGSASFGALALAVALAGLVLQFADFRTWEVVVRLVPPFLKGAVDDGGAPMIQALILVDLAAGLLGMTLTLSLALILAAFVGGGASQSGLIRAYALAIPWILVSSGTCGGVLRLTDRFRLLAIKSVVVSGSQLALVGAALWSHTGPAGVVWAFVITEFGHALVSLLILRSILRERGAGLWPKDRLRVLGRLVVARPLLGQMWLSGTIKGLGSRLDVPLLGALTSPGTVANYKLAVDLAGVIAKLGNPVQQVILPEMVKLENQGSWARLRRLAVQSTLVLAVPIVPALAVITAASGRLVQLAAGAEYAGAGPVLALVSIGVGINTMLVWSRPLLVARMRVGAGNVISVVGAAIQLAIIAAFAGRWGAVAAGAGNAAMFTFSSIAGAITGLR
jgi:O-antigen/teichoic acid export membrane protein